MRRPGSIGIVLALLAGTGSVFVERVPRAGVERVPVVLAADDLRIGRAITEDDVAVRMIAASSVGDATTYALVEDVVGRIPMERIYENEPIRSERLARREAGVGINALIAPCRVAVSIPAAVAIEPGAYVDVIVAERTVASAVKVLASTDHGAVLEVTPDEARDVVHADRVIEHDGAALEVGPATAACRVERAPISPRGGHIESSPQGGPYRSNGRKSYGSGALIGPGEWVPRSR